jgi:hypothetical protein
MIEQARLLTLKAAWMMNQHGNKAARTDIAMIKVAAPQNGLPGHRLGGPGLGGAGVTSDYGPAYSYATARVLRLADGPDQVHRNQIARLELRKYRALRASPADRPRSCRATPHPASARGRYESHSGLHGEEASKISAAPLADLLLIPTRLFPRSFIRKE